MKRKWHHSDTAILVMAAIVLLGLLGGPAVMGATVNTLKSFGFPWSDTSFFAIRDQSDSTLVDSTMFDNGAVTFPYDTLYTWDNTKNFTMKRGEYFPGDGWAVWDETMIFTFATSPTPTYLVSWYIIDSANDVVVPGAKAVSKNWALDATLASPRADANGIALTSVDSDSIATIVTATGYIFPTSYDSIFFTTDTSDTIFGYSIVPIPTGSAADSVCLVHGWILDNASGTVRGMEGKQVTFTLVNDVFNVCLDRAFYGNTVTTNIDSDGYFAVNLAFSSCLALHGNTTTDNVNYIMTVENSTKKLTVTVPIADTYEVVW